MYPDNILKQLLLVVCGISAEKLRLLNKLKQTPGSETTHREGKKQEKKRIGVGHKRGTKKRRKRKKRSNNKECIRLQTHSSLLLENFF